MLAVTPSVQLAPSSTVKCSQEKIEKLLVKMEWAPRGGTDLSETPLSNISPGGLVFRAALC